MNNLTRLAPLVALLAFASFPSAAAAEGAAAAEATAPAAASVTIPMNLVDANGTTKPIGTVTATDSAFGLLLKPALTGLPPGLHGFHVHEFPNCGPSPKDGVPMPAQTAGGHLDPARTGRHEGPYGNGHLGDLPGLYVDAAGNADTVTLAPRLKVADLAKRSLMIHAGGDNLSDQPAPLGGGGMRMACGVVPAATK